MKNAVLLIGFLTGGILPAPPAPGPPLDPPSSISPGNDENWRNDSEVTSYNDFGPWCPPERDLLNPIYWNCTVYAE